MQNWGMVRANQDSAAHASLLRVAPHLGERGGERRQEGFWHPLLHAVEEKDPLHVRICAAVHGLESAIGGRI